MTESGWSNPIPIRSLKLLLKAKNPVLISQNGVSLYLHKGDEEFA
jgi:hypothetical protein